jgi:hypothetical protein
MRAHARPGSLAVVGLLLTSGVAGCTRDGTPRRVPADAAPCSVTMRGRAEASEAAIRLAGLAVTERSWVLGPPQIRFQPPKPGAVYAVRRGSLARGAALRDAALLEAAAARVARGVALQAGTNPTIATIATPLGAAVELRWPLGKLRNATRLHLIPGGYCEVTILGALTDAEVAAYFATTQLGPAPGR